jgi:hypothetical protein
VAGVVDLANVAVVADVGAGVEGTLSGAWPFPAAALEPTSVPHSPQNRARSTMGVPQVGQTSARRVPQVRQNFWPGRVSAPQLGQFNPPPGGGKRGRGYQRKAMGRDGLLAIIRRVSVFSERRPAIAVAAVAFVVLNMALASAIVFGAYSFDVALFGQRGALAHSGRANPDLLRLGALVDLVGYLALAPVVLYLHPRLRGSLTDNLRQSGLASLLSAGGLGFVLVGSIGAALLSSVGPYLLEPSAADAAAQAARGLQFGALENSVFVGLWGTLELPLLSIWLFGVSWIVRAEGRVFAWVGGGAGLGTLAYGVMTGLTGTPPVPITGPLDGLILAGVGLLPIWVLWLAFRLWRGR